MQVILYNEKGERVHMSKSLKMAYIPKMFTQLVESLLDGADQFFQPLDKMDYYRLGILCSQQEYTYKVLNELKSGFIKKLSEADKARIDIIQHTEEEFLGYALTIEKMEELLDELIFEDYPYRVTEG